MSRKMKKWLKGYLSAGSIVKMDVCTFSLSSVSFPTWRWEMSRKVKTWFKSYPSGGRLVKMDLATFSLFLHGGGR